MIVGRAMVRDLFDGIEAHRLMSQIAVVFAIAPALKPCRTRKPISDSMLQAHMQPAEASTKTAAMKSVTLRRPKLSDNAPWKSVIAPNGSRYAVIVC